MELYQRLLQTCYRFPQEIAIYDQRSKGLVLYSALQDSMLKLIVRLSLLGVCCLDVMHRYSPKKKLGSFILIVKN